MKKLNIYVAPLLMIATLSTSTTFTDESQPTAMQTKNIKTNITNLQELSALFPKTVKEIGELTASTILIVQQELDNLKQAKELTFNSTMRTLDLTKNKLFAAQSTMSVLLNVHPDEKIRNAAIQANQTLEEFSIDNGMDVELYQLIQNYYDNYSQDEELTSADKLLITDYLDACKRSGLHLPQETLQKVKALKKELATIQQEFRLNINNDDSTIKVSANELVGLDEKFIQQLEQDGDQLIIPCQPPVYVAIMKNCSLELTRKKMLEAFGSRAYPKNESVFINMLKKRQELAELIGHDNFASLDLDQTSAKTIDNVQNFLLPIAEQCQKKAEIEFEKLKQDLPESVQLQEDGTFNRWDYTYTYNQFIKKYFAIDDSKVAKYFPMQKVLDGIFAIYQDFLDLTFKQVQPEWSWHEDVILLEVYSATSEQLLGYIFLDLYPRANKFSHACVHPMLASYNDQGEQTTSLSTLICNFPKPTKENPSLLKYHDVETFFHEFGHAMHHVLSRTVHPGQGGIETVAMDFVETPSQMFEEWMSQPDMLKLVSSHYETGEPLPQDIIDNIIQLKKVDSGHQILRQCMYGIFALHSMTNSELSYNPGALWKSLCKKYSSTLFTHNDNDHNFASFGHLASEFYASKYYSYLWTKVFAVDLFDQIKKHNFNDKYKQKAIKLLSAGSSVKPDELLEEFLGRKPNQEAFLSDLGLN